MVKGGCPRTTEAEADLSEGVMSGGRLVSPLGRGGGESAEWVDREGSDEEEDERCWVCGMEGDPEDEDEDRGVVRVEEAGGEDVERFGAIRDERRVKELVDPRKPTAKEVEEHERTHLPYRNWCGVCV